MKRIIAAIFVVFVVFASLGAASAGTIDFSTIDAGFERRETWKSSLDALTGLADGITDNSQKAEVCWRMSLFACYIGSDQKTTDEMRQWYAKGIEYAQKGLDANPLSRECWLWHCACVGRDAETRGLSGQLKAVDVMLKDLDMLLNILRCEDYSEAWHAMGEIFWKHPFKSTSAAVSYFRRTIDTIPAGEIRMVSYRGLAEALYARNWSAGKRVSEFAFQQKAWAAGQSDSVTMHYQSYEGRNGSNVKPAWSTKTLGELSDRQEAKIILMYATMLYDMSPAHGDADTRDYIRIQELLSSW